MSEETLYVTLVSATTSLIIAVATILIKSHFDKKDHVTKLNNENEIEQRKMIKEILSEYKVHLINACDLLRGRVNNLSKIYDKKHHHVDGDYANLEKKYFHTTIYRILNLFAWMKVLDNNLTILDTTIASPEDLYLVKYMRLMRRVLQQYNFVDGIQDKDQRTKDMISRDALDEMCHWMIVQNRTVLTYSEYKKEVLNHQQEIEPLCRFIDGINPEEERRRWDRLCTLHLLLLTFLSSYGYDFNYSDQKRLTLIIGRHKKNDIHSNLIKHIGLYKLTDEPNIKRLIELIK